MFSQDINTNYMLYTFILVHMIAKVSGCGFLGEIVLTMFLYLDLSIHQFSHPFILSFIYPSIYPLILFIHITELHSLTTTTSLKQQQNPLLNSKFYLNLHPVLVQKPHPLIPMYYSVSCLVQKD